MPRALIVDDDPDVGDLLTEMLRAHGYEVECASDGVHALASLAKAVPDVVLLDVSMPDLGGLEVLERIRREELDAAVVLMTAFGSEDVAVGALRRGADEYLRKPFSGAELARVLGHSLELLQGRRAQASLRHTLETEALLDPLTGIPNRRFFDRELARLETTADANPRAIFALVLVDIDHFKAVNDAYGHPAGDEVLRIVARTLAENIRKTDVAARIGGEEFALLLPFADAAGAAKLANGLRRRIAAAAIHAGDQAISVTISAGAAEWRPGAHLLSAADEALYRAKQEGRNRVEAG